MKVRLSKTAQKEYKKLPDEIKDKANNKFLLLDLNLHHPQLLTKKMTGLKRWNHELIISIGLLLSSKKIQF